MFGLKGVATWPGKFKCNCDSHRNWHTWPRFSVTEAVLMLREHHHPTMLNMPDALVWVRLELNMQGSKKEKFIDAYSVMTPVAHPFERGVAEKSVLVFVQKFERFAITLFGAGE